MLFNIYHNGSSATDFQIDLTENAIVKPNSVARLLKAFIPHAKKVTIGNTKICDLIVNDRNGDAIAINIPATGDIDLQTLAGQITTAINTAMTGLNNNIQGAASYDRTKGSGAGAFNIVVNAMSRYFTTIEAVNFNNAPYNDANFLIEELVQGVTTNVTYTKLDTNKVNCDFTAAGGQTESFAQCCTADTLINLTHFSKNIYDNLTYPPSQLTEFGTIQYKIGANIGTNSVWFGTCDTTTGTIADRQPNEDVGFLDKLNNVPVAVFIPFTAFPANSAKNTSANAYLAGGLYIWEKQDNGDMALVVDDDGFAAAAGDEFALTTANGHHYAYHVKRNGTDQWEQIDVIDGRPRVLTPQDARLFPAFSIFEKTANDQDVLQVIGGALDNGGIADYGDYIQMSLTQDFATSLGYTQLTYTDNDTLASIDAANQEDFNVVQTTDDTPFININIANLPLSAFVNNNVNREGLSTAPTLGSVSRFDRDGSFKTMESLYMDYPTHTVPLNNANELYLSQLKFQIRDSNGKIPTDLTTPLGIVFEITETR
tara:strand:- start:1446 stop:3068 length:1623 start_codon:yes stop_codon:yes gene_type:complete